MSDTSRRRMHGWLAGIAALIGVSGPAAQGVRIDLAPTACPAGNAPAPSRLELPPTPHLGIAHIAVVQEIERQGLDVKVVAGSSVGALVGALWASGMPAAEIERLHRSVSLDDVGAFAWSRAGVFDNEGLRRRLERAFTGRAIESWPRRFGAVATDLASGERMVLARGEGALAVQASTAMPAIFLPVLREGRRLADGALVEPVPVDAARELGADFVIAVDVAYRPHEEPAVTATQIAFQAMHILVNTLAREQMRRADVAIRIDLHAIFLRCGHDALVAAGREAMRSAWPSVAGELARSAARRISAPGDAGTGPAPRPARR